MDSPAPYLQVRGASHVLLAGAGVSVMAPLTAAVTVILPTIGGLVGARTPVSLFLPLCTALALVAAVETRKIPQERVSSRAIGALDAGLALTALGVSLVGCALSSLLAGGEDPVSQAVARNTAGYIGLALLANGTGSVALAAALPVAYVLCSSTFGTGYGGAVHWWAWPIAANNSTSASVLASIIFGVAIGSMIARGAVPIRRQTRPVRPPTAGRR